MIEGSIMVISRTIIMEHAQANVFGVQNDAAKWSIYLEKFSIQQLTWFIGFLRVNALRNASDCAEGLANSFLLCFFCTTVNADTSIMESFVYLTMLTDASWGKQRPWPLIFPQWFTMIFTIKDNYNWTKQAHTIKLTSSIELELLSSWLTWSIVEIKGQERSNFEWKLMILRQGAATNYNDHPYGDGYVLMRWGRFYNTLS